MNVSVLFNVPSPELRVNVRIGRALLCATQIKGFQSKALKTLFYFLIIKNFQFQLSAFFTLVLSYPFKIFNISEYYIFTEKKDLTK